MNNQVDIITALKLVLQSTDGEAREVLRQAVSEIKHLRTLASAGLELAVAGIEGQPTDALCQAIIKESQ